MKLTWENVADAWSNTNQMRKDFFLVLWIYVNKKSIGTNTKQETCLLQTRIVLLLPRKAIYRKKHFFHHSMLELPNIHWLQEKELQACWCFRSPVKLGVCLNFGFKLRNHFAKRYWNTGLVSSRVSLTSWGKVPL